MGDLSILFSVITLLCLPGEPGGEDAPREGSAPAVGIEERTGCLSSTCHADLNRKSFLHEPVKREKCRLCHAPSGRPGAGGERSAESGGCVETWELLRPESELCNSCHPISLKNYVHDPVAEGKCLGCHDPHQADHAHLLAREPAAGLCLECHREEPFLAQKHLHAPIESGGCILCHEPHSSWNRRLLAAEGSALCITCHGEVEEAIASSRHLHPPVREGCISCHDPHAAAEPLQLRGGSDLCLGCHPEVAEDMARETRIHGALTSEGECLNCHGGHTSPFPSLLRRSPLDSCLGCHDRSVEAAGGGLLADIAGQLSRNPFLHGPLRRADCSACHQPHAGSNFRLLRKPYPRDFYLAEFDLESYDLCFQCHLPAMVLEEKGDSITRFRDGDRNLHHLHVNRERSRTCRACHDEHASSNPDHVRQTFVFGNWRDAPVRFERLADGGSCTPACHEKKEYHRMPASRPPDGEGNR